MLQVRSPHISNTACQLLSARVNTAHFAPARRLRMAGELDELWATAHAYLSIGLNILDLLRRKRCRMCAPCIVQAPMLNRAAGAHAPLIARPPVSQDGWRRPLLPRELFHPCSQVFENLGKNISM